jgi:hypothetical protein
MEDGKTKDCEMHGRKHSLDIIWPRALRKCIFNFTVLKMFEFLCIIGEFITYLCRKILMFIVLSSLNSNLYPRF